MDKERPIYHHSHKLCECPEFSYDECNLVDYNGLDCTELIDREDVPDWAIVLLERGESV